MGILEDYKRIADKLGQQLKGTKWNVRFSASGAVGVYLESNHSQEELFEIASCLGSIVIARESSKSLPEAVSKVQPIFRGLLS